MLTNTMASARSAAPAAWPAMQQQPKQHNALAALGTVASVRRDHEVFAEGDQAANLYKVVSGAVRVVKQMADGRRQIVEFILPGDFFGLEAGDTHTFGAEAVVDCTLVRYSRRAIEMLAERELSVSRLLRDIACSGLSAARARLVSLGRKTAQERVASFLVELAERTAGETDAQDVRLPMSRYDIADHLGLTVETVSRTLTTLKRTGVIALRDTHHVAITDLEALRELDAAN